MKKDTAYTEDEMRNVGFLTIVLPAAAVLGFEPSADQDHSAHPWSLQDQPAHPCSEH